MQNDRYRLSGTYDRLKRTLLEHPDSGRLQERLDYWVLPTDRRLPIAFLDRTLGELLALPLEDLMTTPGVGTKKILAFFDLLRRAARATPTAPPFGLPSESTGPSGPLFEQPFDLETVSDAVWSTWCDTINRCGFREETLGRLAPTLQTLPTVMWRVTLDAYADLSLAQVRGLKTHGTKRVRAILEVFRTVHEAASVAVLPESIDLVLAPRLIAKANRWLARNSDGTCPPLSGSEVREHLVKPLLDQVRLDRGSVVADLAGERLRSVQSNRSTTITELANQFGMTRARVYQIMDDCGRALTVRWPEGRWLLTAFARQLGGDRVDDAEQQDAEALAWACSDLFCSAKPNTESGIPGWQRPSLATS